MNKGVYHKGLIMLCFLLFFSLIIAKDKVSVRVYEYLPYYYKDADGLWTGIDLEIIKEVLEKAEINYELKELPWSRALDYLKSGKLDILLSFSKTFERERFSYFIGPYREEKMSLIVKKENLDLDIKELDDLVKYKKNIGIQDNTYYGELSIRIEKDPKFAENFEIVYDHNLNLRKIEYDRILGFFEERNFALYEIKNNKSYKNLAVHKFSLKQSGVVYFGLSKKMDIIVVNKIKKAFNKLKEEGDFLKDIERKWTDKLK